MTTTEALTEREQQALEQSEERHEDVITAPNPPTLLPKTMASPSLLAHLITAKFDDGIPLYRVSRQLERSGMDLSPGTAGTWVNRIGGDKIIPLIELLREAIFIPALMHMDESYLNAQTIVMQSLVR